MPTIAQSGFTLRAWVGLYAPKSTLAPLIEACRAAAQAALASPALSAFFETVGFDAWFGGPGELRRAAASDSHGFVDVIA